MSVQLVNQQRVDRLKTRLLKSFTACWSPAQSPHETCSSRRGGHRTGRSVPASPGCKCSGEQPDREASVIPCTAATTDHQTADETALYSHDSSQALQPLFHDYSNSLFLKKLDNQSSTMKTLIELLRSDDVLFLLLIRLRILREVLTSLLTG